jgi:hypothetical protein
LITNWTVFRPPLGEWLERKIRCSSCHNFPVFSCVLDFRANRVVDSDRTLSPYLCLQASDTAISPDFIFSSFFFFFLISLHPLREHREHLNNHLKLHLLTSQGIVFFFWGVEKIKTSITVLKKTQLQQPHLYFISLFEIVF